MPGNITSSRGYNSSFRGAIDPSAFYAVFTGNFGAPAPVLSADLTYEAGSGSLATGTAYVKVTWITQSGVSLPSNQEGVAIAASTGAVSVAQPTLPTSGETIIGWQIYSEGSSGAEALNTAAASSSPSPTTLVITSPTPGSTSTVIGYPIADTTVLVKVYGTGAGVPTYDASGIQPALPTVAANSTADYYFIVPNSGSLWKNYKPVYCYRPDSITETAGIVLSLPLECQSPLYPGATPGSATYTQEAVAPGTYMVMNGTLFVATQTGTVDTATTFIGGAAFNVSKGTTVTDGSVTWLCLGKATLVHARFANVLSGSAATPTAMEYDLYQE